MPISNRPFFTPANHDVTKNTKPLNYFSPRIIGRPVLPLPITTIFEFELVASFSVASSTLHDDTPGDRAEARIANASWGQILIFAFLIKS